MNAKTYCPLGKIDCGNFCGGDGGSINCGGVYFSAMNIEVCPRPSKWKILERYNMCEDQPAQIECYRKECVWNGGGGMNLNCKNISPAIRLGSFHPTDTAYECLSLKRT
jgi:hypothetical protein